MYTVIKPHYVPMAYPDVSTWATLDDAMADAKRFGYSIVTNNTTGQSATWWPVEKIWTADPMDSTPVDVKARLA